MSVPRITGLYVYPVKSCAGIAVDHARLGLRGLQRDREWMLIEPSGTFVTQRTLPRLALIRPSLGREHLRLEAPDMPSVEIHAPDSQQDTTKPPRSVEIWGRTWQGIDEGDHVASWFTDFLGTSLRLVRFAPDQRRLSAPEWTGTVEAENSFSDGFPILVLSRASLDELNGRLLGPPIPMNRFRPNIVLDGVTAYFEDHHPTLSNSAVELRMVKPCTRCQITTVNQDTAESGREPLRTLSTYRRDERLAGITFGQNAIILRGFGEMLHLGMEFAPSLRPH